MAPQPAAAGAAALAALADVAGEAGKHVVYSPPEMVPTWAPDYDARLHAAAAAALAGGTPPRRVLALLRGAAAGAGLDALPPRFLGACVAAGLSPDADLPEAPDGGDGDGDGDGAAPAPPPPAPACLEDHDAPRAAYALLAFRRLLAAGWEPGLRNHTGYTVANLIEAGLARYQAELYDLKDPKGAAQTTVAALAERAPDRGLPAFLAAKVSGVEAVVDALQEMHTLAAAAAAPRQARSAGVLVGLWLLLLAAMLYFTFVLRRRGQHGDAAGGTAASCDRTGGGARHATPGGTASCGRCRCGGALGGGADAGARPLAPGALAASRARQPSVAAHALLAHACGCGGAARGAAAAGGSTAPLPPHAAWAPQRTAASGRGGVRAAAALTERELTIKLSIASSTDRLDLSGCDLAEVPEAVFELTGLVELSLAGNQLTALPSAVSRLTNLRRLVVAGNWLQHLPPELWELAGLEGLWLHGNLLEDLPPQLGQLAQLRALSLAGNCLAAVPDSLSQLVHLADLNLSGNALTALPAGISALTGLTMLSLHGNALDALPPAGWGTLGALVEVTLQGNRLTELPDSFAQLTALTELSIADNRIARLPDDLSAWRRLAKFHAYGNALTQLPLGPRGLPALLPPAPAPRDERAARSAPAGGGATNTGSWDEPEGGRGAGVVRSVDGDDGAGGGDAGGGRLVSLWLEGNPLQEACVAALVGAMAPRGTTRLGLDQRQLVGAARAAADALRDAGSMSVRAGVVEGAGPGYFKLQPGPPGPPGCERVLVVAFGSAPGLPNWGGVMRLVAAAAEAPEQRAFDVLYVVDPCRTWYHGGDPAAMAETYGRRLSAVTGRYRHVVMVGDSMGATGALLFAPLATSVLAFCPQVDLATSSIRPGRPRAWQAALQASLQASLSGSTARVRVFTGTWQHDVDQANLLAHHPRLSIKRAKRSLHQRGAAAPGAGAAADVMDITHLTQAEAVAVDEELMGPLGFSVDQLMELAGLSVAVSLAREYPAATHGRVLVLAGPGNNGGDGLVAARHLTHFGYAVTVCYPKPTPRPLYDGLVTQCRALGVPFVGVDELAAGGVAGVADVVLDALFGFSFRGPPRAPFDALLQMLAPAAAPPPVVSVDIPSGWDVEAGPGDAPGALAPDMLVSLTAPKLAARFFAGRHHYLGGRFVPPAIRDKYRLRLPPFPGTDQCVRLPARGAAAAAEAASAPVAAGAAAAAGAPPSPADMRVSYELHGLLEGEAAADPVEQFRAWFAAAVESKARRGRGGLRPHARRAAVRPQPARAPTGPRAPPAPPARRQVCEEPNAMAVASVGASGAPSLRYVLLKGFDERGFVFYTNYDSRKGRELAASGRAALAFWWEGLQRQVRVEGLVERVPEAEATAYFDSRPRGSQIGAWVSLQSQAVFGGRREIEARQAELEARYADASLPVPRPPHWGGYLVRPLAVEFWQGRPSRLHDRLVYTRPSVDSADWALQRLYP
ncbi:PPOX1 [Scenedesmus sp. PABB004]|nr:PPOX1 [Scenedesmus sp. PABB004]